MFTGIIQSVGNVKEMKETSSKDGKPQSFTLKIEAHFSEVATPTAPSDFIHLGESIAVNGACLTVTHFNQNERTFDLTFDLAPETIDRTSLSKLVSASFSRGSAYRKVNLERSLRLGDRLSGHWVQGHVDGTATFVGLVKHHAKNQSAEDTDKTTYELTFTLDDSNLLKYCVKKGSISLDGISLTIHDIQQNQLMFQIIPHTWKETNLSDLILGEKVNIEVDILAKYIENLAPKNR